MLYDEPTTVVLIDDDPGHARLIERNLRRGRLTYEIVHLKDGYAALEYFFPSGELGARRPVPMLVLLDVHLPGLDGIQVLARLKGDRHTKHIPVFILTSTEDLDTIETCYALGCNVYLTKPVEYVQFVDTLQTLGTLLTCIAVPKGRPSCDQATP